MSGGPARAAAAGGGLARELAVTWRRLGFEQRVAAIACVLLVASTFGPFSFVEAAELLVALGVLALLHARARGRRFHLPFGDGTVVLAAGCWAALLIVVRLFDRPLGQNLLALACAAVLALAGLAERRSRPPDDLPADEAPTAGGAAAESPSADEAPTEQASTTGPTAADDATTRPLPPR